MVQSRASYTLSSVTLPASVYNIITYRNKHTIQTRKGKLVIRNISNNHRLHHLTHNNQLTSIIQLKTSHDRDRLNSTFRTHALNRP